MHTEINYLSLASSYSGFLSTFAGVCTTVLALVLTIGRGENKTKIYPILVATLLVAIVTSLVGYHLFAETSAIKIDPVKPFGGARLFFVASINTYLSALLFLFSLVLLPAAYMKDEDFFIRHLALVAFLTISTGMVVWVCLSATFYLPFPRVRSPLITSGILSVAAVLYSYFHIATKKFPMAVFVTCIIVSGISMIRLSVTFDAVYLPHKWDEWLFCVGTLLPIGAFVGLSISKLTRREVDVKTVPQI